MISPDNFIFHSNFWYPINYIGGRLNLSNASIPATFELSDQYEPGDFYMVVREQDEFFNNQSNKYVANTLLSDSFMVSTKGNKLLAFKGAQATGAKFNGVLHWRIYKKPKNFNFLSVGKLEKILISKTGSYEDAGAFESKLIDVPTDTPLMYLRGIWRRGNGSWYAMNTQTNGPDGRVNAYIYQTSGKQQIAIQYISESYNPSQTIEYKVVGIKLYD